MSQDFEGVPTPPHIKAVSNEAQSNPEIRKDCALLKDQGDGSGNLEKNLQIFETPKGVKIYAATDSGHGKRENHDRVIIDSVGSQFVVLDGMGSAGASQILAETILAHPNDLKGALEKAKLKMATSGIHNGACLISGHLTAENTFKVYQVGDCGAVVFDRVGHVKFSAADKKQVKMRLETLEVDIPGVDKKSQQLVDTLPGNFISSHSGELHGYSDIELVAGDTALLFSDAVWCNLSMNELSKLVMQHRNPQDLFRKISELLNQKMRSVDVLSQSGFSSYLEKAKSYYGGDYVPSVDNQSLVLFQLQTL